jgi:4-aminobutyrate aminotransferase-like enzyme
MLALKLSSSTPENAHSNAELSARRSASVSCGMGPGMPIYADHTSNAEVWDVEGKRYIDFGGGMAAWKIASTGSLNSYSCNSVIMPIENGLTFPKWERV